VIQCQYSQNMKKKLNNKWGIRIQYKV